MKELPITAVRDNKSATDSNTCGTTDPYISAIRAAGSRGYSS